VSGFNHLVGEREQLYLVCGTARMARCWSPAGAEKNQVDNVNFISKGEGVTALTDDWSQRPIACIPGPRPSRDPGSMII